MSINRKALMVFTIALISVFLVYSQSNGDNNNQNTTQGLLDEVLQEIRFVKEDIPAENNEDKEPADSKPSLPINKPIDTSNTIKQDDNSSKDVNKNEDNKPVVPIDNTKDNKPDSNTNDSKPVNPVDNTKDNTRVITDRGSFQHVIDSASSEEILGIDISHHQSDRGEIDWEKVAESKVEFAFIKISEGSTYKDPYAKRHFEGARSQGIAAGGYHYARPAQPIEQDAKSEVAHFISRLKIASNDYGDLPAVLDLEDPLYPGTNGLSTEDLLRWAEIFNEEFEKHTGHKIIVYTGNWFINSWNNFNSPNNPLVDYSLWIADYYANRTPFGGWESWLVWQFSDKGKIDGITGDVDLNISSKKLLTYIK